MDLYELKPTEENLIKTLSGDTIGRNKNLFMLAELLDSITTSCSIAIDGSWGSGKTFFVKQAKMVMDAHNSFVKSITDDNKEKIKALNTNLNIQPQVSVYYDAWENDNDEDPILSLVYSIISSVDTDYYFEENNSCLDKAAAILDFFTGKSWSDLISKLKSSNALDDIRKRKNIENDIKEFLTSLLAEKGNRLVVFIDELDRCNPSYAVKLLERIKHYFGNDKITFVFSINTKELQHTIKNHYGADFDACRYLDRFFDLRITLPPADMAKFYNSIEFDESRTVFDSIRSSIIKKYNFSLREITRFLKITRLAMPNSLPGNRHYDYSFGEGRAKRLCITAIVPIMLGLSMYDRDKYENFITGKDSSPMIEILSAFEDLFGTLLERDESFEEAENKKKVTIEEKLNKVYNALFNTTYTYNMYKLRIGECTFEEYTKTALFNIVSLLSEFTNIEKNDAASDNE